MPTDLILGTAGHIDHGKTSLVKALTGVDTDRLPEEKRRGITIDLGFAELMVGEYRLGIVDVPGHERFVRNMLAGATGMDLAMLVVAADDSIKPQTVEHLEILRLLELPAGVVALTKCDMVDAEWLALVEEEIRELVQGTFLADAPIVPTSVVTGEGLDRLREALRLAAVESMRSRAARLDAPFRMAVDRVFTVPGHGAVVTGSVSAGRAAVGDELFLEPGRIAVRVRGLRNHDRPVEEVCRGQRAAINLAGVRHDEIRRGHELGAPGHLRASRRILAEIRLASDAVRPLKHRSRVRLHLGAAEFLARVRLLEGDAIPPGGSGCAQCFLDKPAVAVWRQPFVIREESPVVTIGGGIVLDSDSDPLRRPTSEDLARARNLLATDPVARASASLYFAGFGGWDPTDLARTAGIDDPRPIADRLRAAGDLRTITLSHARSIHVHRQSLRRLGERIEAMLGRLHDEHPLRGRFDRRNVAHGFRYVGEEAIVDAALVELRDAGRVRLTNDTVGLAGRGPQLSQNEEKLLRQIVEWHREAGLEGPTLADLQARTTRNHASVPQLVKIAADQGDLVQIQGDYHIHAETDRAIRERLAAHMASGQGMTMSEMRDLLGTTRKFAVPYGEYLDRIGVTRRQGDLRVLAAAPPTSAVLDGNPSDVQRAPQHSIGE
ncbi:MAG: selenocysteine-specific translation elongation factor [Planctomycetes bacterium]|nr:selenocysteine-specific translation elongation factor [Planctomycetota bacterium]